MTIYGDVLFIVNWYVNFFLILGVSRLTFAKISIKRALIAGGLGGLLAFQILLPPLGIPLSMALGLLNGGLVCWAAFGWKGIKSLVYQTFLFFTCSFIFAGLMTALSQYLPRRLIKANNGQVYMDFPLWKLGLFTAVAYGIICLFKRLINRKSALQESYRIIIAANGKTVSLDAMADTGNLLRDSFTGRFVVVCPAEKLEGIIAISKECSAYEDAIDLISENPGLRGLRLIPYGTASGKGLLPVFLPDKLYICDGKGQSAGVKAIDALVGASPALNMSAVFHPALMG